MHSQITVEKFFNNAGININGVKEWDIKVNHQDFYTKVLKDGSLGFGESYIDELWDCESLDKCIFNILRANVHNKYATDIIKDSLKEKVKNLITPHNIKNCKKSISHHYDTGNKLFKFMLDKRMVYSCGYWKDVDNLDDAQEQKLELICKKIGLKKDMTLLDVGCGWGSLMKYASEKYGAICTGLTLSKEQKHLGEKLSTGLPIRFLLQDYRELSDLKFDRIVSIGMFEHIGPKNYGIFMQKMHNLLVDDGVMLLHTIGGVDSKKHTEPWIRKYIFPQGVIPKIRHIGKAMEDYFYMEDWHDFGPDYDKTLMAWHKNFTDNWQELSIDYDEKFKRMWEYYLLSCAGSFRARDLALWQIVMTKKKLEKIECA